MECKLHMVLLKKDIKNLFHVNYNKSASSCNPAWTRVKKLTKK